MKRSRPFLSLDSATFRLGDRLVFPKTSWSFDSNQQWAILGPNGSGKSLFADALRGRLPLVGGALEYHFRVPHSSAAEDLIGHVSFDDRKAETHETVIQSRWNSAEDHSSLPVEEFLSFNRVMDINPFEVTRGLRAQRRAFAARQRRAVRDLGLEPFLPRPLLTLSNGEMQRVHLCRALSRPLKLLILDEPFTGLDVAARRHFHAMLEKLMRTPLRVLLVTTRAEDLPRAITHALWIERCRVVEASTKAEVLATKRARLPRPVKDSGLHGMRTQPASRNRATQRNDDPPGRPLIRLRNVSVRYDQTVVLSQINWTVLKGESWALVGRNGSGKSTLLALIQGDHPQAYASDVGVFGVRRDGSDSIWHLKRDIGFLSPELQVHFEGALTGFEAVASGLRDTVGIFEPLTRKEREQTRRTLRRLGLSRLARARLSALSTGEQRMLLLARALVKGPRLLLLDEPCLGLDGPHRQELVQRVDSLIREKHVTVIYVTHRADELPRSIRHVFTLKRGRGTAGRLAV